MTASAERERFDAAVAKALGDRRLQDWLADFQRLGQDAYVEAMGELDDKEAWRDALSEIRAHTVAHLDSYVDQFATNVEANGGHVSFAATAAEARDYVLQVARSIPAQRVVKAKSMVTEEIDLNAALEAAGMEVVETDLGAFIVQLTGDDPYHIIAPALHLTLEQVRELFSRESGEELPAEPDVLAAYARRRLREKFLSAELGISGGNFGIASTGTVVLVTNEGNGRMSTTLPGTHVAVMGMERLLPDWESLDTALTLLTRAGTSQRISTYVSAISGPRRDGDRDGPDELHVVLLDNGRSRILGTQYEPVLKCVQLRGLPGPLPRVRVYRRARVQPRVHRADRCRAHASAGRARRARRAAVRVEPVRGVCGSVPGAGAAHRPVAGAARRGRLFGTSAAELARRDARVR